MNSPEIVLVLTEIIPDTKEFQKIEVYVRFPAPDYREIRYIS